MKLDDLDPHFRTILATNESFLVSYPANWGALDLAPFGLAIARERLYTATSLASRGVVDGLHRLDAATFGDQDMLMPRWVLFDCGEFPGIVYGFGRRARDLPENIRAHYGVGAGDDAFVPLSMWVAIRCAEDGAWFGHNLSSANLLFEDAHRLRGLGTLTKVLGIRLTGATKQYGATQWDSDSISLHLRMGDMHLLSAFTPAHTHAETLSYRIDVDRDRLWDGLRAGWRRPPARIDRTLDGNDSAAIRALHQEIEDGVAWRIVGTERACRAGQPQRVHLARS